MNRLRSLAWTALMTNSMIAMSYDTSVFSPGIFEVDLISPRNETYTPSALLPIVFALQNPTLVQALEFFIIWELWEGNNHTSPGSVTNGALEPALSNLTSSDPLFVTRFIDTTPYPVGFWTFAWSLVVSNCTHKGGYEGEDIATNGAIVFTISQSGQAPNLTSSENCGSMDAYAYNVTSDGDACAILGPSPTTNPCAATVNPSAASSIMAAATAFACDPLETSIYPNVTCPTSTAKSSNSARQCRMAAASTWLTLLTMMTALIHFG
ncbi:hypothetical protein BO94DRAFT_538435 [Aspergillus sclerotioniger CBS 115572]|uniref:DUF7136 domain-containing protein n=1 Tax=Aspergillus sclerotioniger CBS 115572 TaxID=1450535 RepID=A0A317VSK1_9EURO|nr:hypothetical protein BO94DRAFT_538435 [Aspergillus sclerotioniger CBS 115572]PWY76007.1 hypothetical protein BO94DRAFT_538435 [Aspergillus sclerotioniger CBS 115572]